MLLLALLLGSVLLVCGWTVWRHMSVARDPARINDDARILIVPFLHYHDARLFRDDYVTRYLQDTLPLGYEWLMMAASKAVDPRALSKALPYPFLVLLALLVAVAARRLGGWGAAWVSMALVLTSELFIDRMSGGLPRMFAFPLVAAAALALVFGRTYWLCGVVLAGALFYPAAAMVCGIALTALLLLAATRDRGDAAAWRLRKRLLVLAATAGLSGVLLAPTALRLRAYGPTLGPDQAAAYPELGPGGRFGPRDRPPFQLIPQLAEAAVRTLSGPRIGERANRTHSYRLALRAPLLVFILLTALAATYLAVHAPAGRRLLALGVAAVVGHVLANALLPHLYLPQRYTLFAIPIVIVLTLPAGLIQLARRLLPGERYQFPRVALLALVFAAALVHMGVGMATDAGLRHGTQASLPVMGFLKTLPPDVMIAGWPRGPIEDVSYVTGRRTFLTFETHPTFHRAYTDHMRERANAVIEAYFATDPAPLQRLRDAHGVTHLVVDRRHYQSPPEYFEPFNALIPPRFDAARRGGAEALRQPDGVRFNDGTYRVLDLSRLAAPATQAAVLNPSSGTPGEGWGEGDSARREPSAVRNPPSS